MALDDVVARAMSKQPEDRYPSAGDLGRAALAALSGAQVSVPERTVATGAAATGTAETRQLPPAPEPSRAAGERTRPDAESPGPAGRGRPWIAVGLIAAIALVVAAVALLGSGGDGDGGETTTAAQKQKTEPRQEEKPQPQPLEKAALISRADDICAASQRRYVAIRDLEGEYSTDVPYAEALVRNARRRVRGLRQLMPPDSLAKPYREYVEAQERVYDTDVQALEAARKEDAAGVEAARNRRDAEDSLRESLARKIGFAVCSVPSN
jgi:hypothetical protein